MKFDFHIDETGTPLAAYARGKYIAVLPVTKYQFERYIWETAPNWINYDLLLEQTGRVSPKEINRNNIGQAFISNINFREAELFCRWAKARPPSSTEWNESHKIRFHNRIIERCVKYLHSNEAAKKVDPRLLTLFTKMHEYGITPNDTTDIGELVSEFSAHPYGRIYLKYDLDDEAFITGSKPAEIKCPEFGFTYIRAQVR